MYKRTLANLPSRRRQNSLGFNAALERHNPGWITRDGEESTDRQRGLPEAIALYHSTDRQTTRFLATVVQEMENVQGNPTALYPTLARHDELLSDRFAERLSQVAIGILPTLSPKRAIEFATIVVNLGGQIWNYSEGKKAHFIEIAIACCETALPMFPCDRLQSQRWGATHDNLALAYSERLQGDRINNLARSFSHYQLASQIFIRHPFPQQWLPLLSRL
ncbi:hypothetical protein J0895_10625 [Phormidium pseudopriestleyi FRX01]|uniref:Uncharacterized protein n=1 Tax=Phormidium pseudopriestleyi FRX01 TaxID=1759528 RepID=A0ABS3FSG0_9CYAN|nr:hypothetical protein [Phormidium pseudopriestleyi]MBO0349556.1 hypothetical protein [Phormidium pseudopriestleyi FRX01]